MSNQLSTQEMRGLKANSRIQEKLVYKLGLRLIEINKFPNLI